jgi:hypothetical protein
MIALSSTPELLAAIATAHRITFSAYLLRPGSLVETALEVRLDGRAYGAPDVRRANQESVQRLNDARARASLYTPPDGSPAIHLKAAVCDQRTYLDDCNFTSSGSDTVLCDDSRLHAHEVRDAVMHGRPPPRGRLALDKRQALDQEAGVIRGARRGEIVEIESEYLRASAVSSALRAAAANGAVCRVLISSGKKDPRALATVQSLRRAGVDVRWTQSNEKFALAEGRAWCGSADATPPFGAGERLDWGVRTNSPAIVTALRSHFESRWKSARRTP